MIAILGSISPVLGWIYAIGAPLYYMSEQANKRQKLRAAQEEQRKQAEMRQRRAAEDAAQAEAQRTARRSESERRLWEAMAAAQAAAAAAAAAKAAADAAARAARQDPASATDRRAQPQGAEARWQSNDPHTVLDVPRGADPATVRAAYATLSKQYHPDRVASLAPEFLDLAEARMRVINAAYQKLRDAQGR